ncbi:MAG: non-homologous end-joining DNA ligase [Wenzhouxiangella sp.]
MLRFGSYTFEASNLDKMLFPDDGITKARVIDYYRRVSDLALPHLTDRFLTLQRFPDGIGEDGFYQQNRSGHFPRFVHGQSAERADGSRIEHIHVRNAAGLVYLAEQATIAFHVWLSRRQRPDRPDRLVFDLDPPGRDFEPVRQAALKTADLLRELGLTPYPMTTGSRGLHVVVPLDGRSGFDPVRDFAAEAADLLACRHPDSLTTEQRRNKRGRRLYLDITRNAHGQTAVMPYSLRPKSGAPVATPLGWDELARPGLTSQTYRLDNLFRRLGQIDEPWAGMGRHRAGLRTARRRLETIRKRG